MREPTPTPYWLVAKLAPALRSTCWIDRVAPLPPKRSLQAT